MEAVHSLIYNGMSRFKFMVDLGYDCDYPRPESSDIGIGPLHWIYGKEVTHSRSKIQ